MRRAILRNAAALTLGGILAQVCMLATEALIARRLGQSAYGIFSTAYAFGLIGIFLIDLGMSWKLIQDGSRDARTMPMLLGTTLMLRAVIALAAYPLMLLGFALLDLGPGAMGFFAVLFGYVVLMSVQNALAAVYAAEQNMHVTAAFQATTPVLILALLLIFPVSVTSLSGVGAAFVAGSLLVTGVWLWTTFRRVPPVIRMREAPRILRESYLFAVTGLLTHGGVRLEVLLLPLFRPLADVGLFAAADKFADIGFKAAILGTRVVAPVLFKQSHAEPEVFHRACRRTLRAASVVGVAAALTLALAATWLVPLVFGQQFSAAGSVLAILGASLATKFMNQGAQVVLTACDRHGRRTAGQALGVGASLAANLFLIPPWGPVGAAIARLMGDCVQLVALVTARGLPVSRLRAMSWLVMPALAGIASFVLAKNFLADWHFWQIPAALLMYAALLLLVGAFRLEEIRELFRQESGRPQKSG
jgi:O-antigen/teichoic acid export membrane protein